MMCVEKTLVTLQIYQCLVHKATYKKIFHLHIEFELLTAIESLLRLLITIQEMQPSISDEQWV